jgi:hypothetical protein
MNQQAKNGKIWFPISMIAASCQEGLEEAKAFSVRVNEARPRVEAACSPARKILSHMSKPIN